MTLTVYEQRDDALHQQAPMPCFKCGRRAYFKRSEWDLFTRMQIKEVESRCCGCGEAVSTCYCASIRSLCPHGLSERSCRCLSV